MRYLTASYTDKGKVREVNQDSLLIRKAEYGENTLVLAVVCDGMGGLKKGELASAEVIRLFEEWFERESRALAEQEQEEFEDMLYDLWEALLQRAHGEIRKYGKLHGIRIGTTVTAILFWQKKYYIAHVGDSRIYEIKNHVIQLTKDQLLAGLNATEQITTGKNILLQGVGASKVVRPIYYSGKAEDDAVYLLCTDGFRHKLSEKEIYQAFKPENLTDKNLMEEQGKAIARMVMDRGEKDNISVILLRTVSDIVETPSEEFVC